MGFFLSHPAYNKLEKKMKKSKWSDYANYLVLADKSNYKLGSTFERYLNFKKVREVLNNMAFTDKSTFGIDGEIYQRKITSTEAKNILNNISECTWNSNMEKIFYVSNQLGILI
jgi:hypothetical protein|tara:strand:+ start:2345 stop:2686 length:342 start_codon:yes stop_codon:yes gene_type:complete